MVICGDLHLFVCMTLVTISFKFEVHLVACARIFSKLKAMIAGVL